MESSAKKRRSFIWNHFVQTSKHSAKCILCSSPFSTKGGSTTNLIRHIRSKHPAVSQDYNTNPIQQFEFFIQQNDETESTETEFIINPSVSAILQPKTKRVKIAIPSEETNTPIPIRTNKTIDEQLLRMIVKDYHSFSVVESNEFKNFVNLLNPEYILPSKNNLSNVLLPQLYTRTAAKVQQQLATVSYVSVTVDRWTSCNNDGYLGVTVHAINENVEVKSYFLDCFKYTEKHSPQNLVMEIERVLLEWNVADKVVVIVSDNMVNIMEAIRIGGWKHISCFADSVSLVAQAGIQQIETIQTQIKVLVEFFRRNPQLLEELTSAQKQMDHQEIILKEDVPTKWNSTLDMFSQVLKLKELFTPMVASENLQIPTLTEQEWVVVEKACDSLRFLQEVTLEISAEKDVSVSKVILLSRALIKHCQKLKNEKNLPLEILKMLEKMIEQLMKKFSNIEENCLLAEATFLDPRFKKQGFQDEKAFEKAKQSIIHMASQIEENKAEECKETITPCKVECDTVWGEFDTKVAHLIDNDNSTMASIIEVNKYLQEALQARKENPLLWWFERKLTYPRLFQLIQKRLCIAATLVSCERVFSKDGQVIMERHSTLSAKKVSQVAFLNYNLK